MVFDNIRTEKELPEHIKLPERVRIKKGHVASVYEGKEIKQKFIKQQTLPRDRADILSRGFFVLKKYLRYFESFQKERTVYLNADTDGQYCFG